MSTSELFSKQNIVTSTYAKFEKIGDQISGVYVARRETINEISGTPKKQYIYTLVNDTDGQPIDVYGKYKEPMGFPVLNNLPFGSHVGLRFDETIPAKKKGYQDAKVINVYYKGEQKPEVLTAYHAATGVFGSQPTAPSSSIADDVPFLG